MMRYPLSSITIIFALVLATSYVASAQETLPLLDNVEPFLTTKKEFEARYGAPVGKNGVDVFRYLVSGDKIDVEYSAGLCTESRPYRLKKGVVLSYSIRFAKPILLKDLSIDFKRFSKDTSGDFPQVYQLINDTDGIVLRVYQDPQESGTDTVFQIVKAADIETKKAMQCPLGRGGPKWN